MKKLLLLFLFSSTISYGQMETFEGIILYKRTTSKNKVSFMTCYFKNGKFRKDESQVLNLKLNETITVFLTKDYINQCFFKVRGREFIVKNLNSGIFFQSVEHVDSTSIINGLECSLLKVKFINDYFDNEVYHERWHSKKLKFNVSKEWYIDYQMISHFDDNICLKFKEARIPPNNIDVPTSYFLIEAIGVYPMELPDSIFVVPGFESHSDKF